MKQMLLSACMMILFGSCKKNPAQVLLEVPYPHQWIFTMDATPDKYLHLELHGSNMKRSEILKSYSLAQLTLDRFREFNVAESKTEYTNELRYSIQFERQRNRWVFAAASSNQQEVHPGTTNSNNAFQDAGGDGYKFFMHEMPGVNEVRTVVIESVEKRGYYISNSPPGFNYPPTQATLTQHPSPQSAPHWQCRSSK